MNKNMSCPDCEKVVEVSEIHKETNVVINGKSVSFFAPMCKCTICGAEFQTMEQLEESLKLGKQAAENNENDLTPEKIISIREKYNASQKAFAIILGMGELTINKYEQGEKPSSSNRMLLLLSEDPACFYKMYSINKNKIGAIQKEKIEHSPILSSYIK
ncbi:MAG: type II toxin-antitoxin system MqsA family antitoxin [Treponema sp.]|nr:type II toxin-antitoxin system MqsA family antitoxin [Treponema sp.]